MVRVFLADSQVIFREGVHAIIDTERDIQVVGEGTTVRDALNFLQSRPADVLVLGAELIKDVNMLQSNFPEVRLVLVGAASGTRRGLTRSASPEELIRIVREAGNKASNRTGENNVSWKKLDHDGG